MKYPITLNPFKKAIPTYNEIRKVVLREYYIAISEDLNLNKDSDLNYISKYDIRRPEKPSFRVIIISNLIENDTDVNSLLFVWLIIAFFCFFLFFPLTFFMSMGLLTIIGALRHEKKMNQYNIKNEEYKRKIKDIEEHNNKVRDFKNFRSEKIWKEMKKFEEDIKIDTNKRIKEEYLKNLKKIIKSTDNIKKAEISPTKGASENYFLQKIEKNKLLSNFTIERDIKAFGYFPDFVFIHKSGLKIDVEIDEPYVGSSKEVIHYYEESLTYYTDEYRNEIFLENNWIVIRFSEKQIIENPINCMKYINHVVESTLNMNFNYDPLKYIQTQNVWSKKIADEMAQFDYRKSYLPKNINSFFY